MRTLWEGISGFFTGMKLGVDIWYYSAFNKKVHRSICWLIAILSVPVNIVFTLVVWAIKPKQVSSILIEVLEDVEDKKEA